MQAMKDVLSPSDAAPPGNAQAELKMLFAAGIQNRVVLRRAQREELTAYFCELVVQESGPARTLNCFTLETDHLAL